MQRFLLSQNNGSVCLHSEYPNWTVPNSLVLKHWVMISSLMYKIICSSTITIIVLNIGIGTSYSIYRFSLDIRRSLLLPNNSKDLDLSNKTDLDLWDCLGKIKLVLLQNFIGLI